MRLDRHGQAVTVVLLSLLVGSGPAGCGMFGDRSGPTPDREAGADGAAAEAEQEEPLPAPELRRDVLGVDSLPAPEELARLRPAATLPPGERTMIYNALGPLLLRVSRADGSVLAEAEAQAGEVLVVDRRSGVRLGGRQVVRGPLDEQAEYALYARPPGGVRREVTRSRFRPETVEEREERAEAMREEEERRRREQSPPTTGPSTRPFGG